MPEFEDPAERLEALVASVQPRFRERFLATIAVLKDFRTVEEIRDLLEAGRIDEALLETELAAIRLGATYNEVFILSGERVAQSIAGNLRTIVSFNQVNARAVSHMTENRLRLITEFTNSQREATREALISGIRRGLNPLDQARNFRDSIGLTQYQVQVVENYRRQLEDLSAGALERRLRDARFDRTVARAIRDKEPLTPEQIDRMVGRYRERWLRYRSEVIARTEALRSVHAGSNEMYLQAIDDGTLEADELIREWKTSGRSNVRDHHRSMEGQKRRVGEPFESGLGNLLEYPGDFRAPAKDSAQCVCAVTTRYRAEVRVTSASPVSVSS